MIRFFSLLFNLQKQDGNAHNVTSFLAQPMAAVMKHFGVEARARRYDPHSRRLGEVGKRKTPLAQRPFGPFLFVCFLAALLIFGLHPLGTPEYTGLSSFSILNSSFGSV